MRGFISSVISNRVLANITLIMVLLVGVLATSNTLRELFPEFSIDVIQVQVPYPGADPEETEEGISRKIEEAIDGLEGIRRYSTISSEGMAAAMIEVAEGYAVDEVRERVRSAIDSIPTFPPDAERPIISELTIRTEVIKLALWGDLEERQLKEWAEDVRLDLQQHPDISQVTVFGTRDYEINIELSEKRMREYGLSFAQVSDAVRRGNLNLAGGTVRTEGEQIRIRTVGRKYTGEEIANIVVLSSPDGSVITLDRIADIRDQFAEEPIYATFNGQPCVTVEVFKTSDEDAIAIAEAVRAYAAEQDAQLPPNANMTAYTDLSELIQARIDLLVNNGLMGLLLIFVILWLFLDLRLSLWVALGIPLSLSGALIVMWMTGASLNMMSLFGLIMVLGIIVDDGIVIGEAVYVHRKSGQGPLDAAVDALREVGLPILAALTTTIVAFMPLLFISGVMGRFIAIFPVVVISALGFSIVKSLFLMPSWLSNLPDLNKEAGKSSSWSHRAGRVRQRISDGLEWFVDHMYTPAIRRLLNWRYVVLSASVSIALVMVGLIQGGFVQFITFQEMDSDYVMATVEFHPGTPVEVTRDATKRYVEALEALEDQLETRSGDPLIKHVYAVAGQMGEGFEARQGSHLGQVQVELLETGKRRIHFRTINRLWEEEVGIVPGALSQQFDALGGGPGGADLEIWLQAEDMDRLLDASSEVRAHLAQYDGVYQIEHDYRPGSTELRIDMRPEAYALGLRLEDLAQQLHMGYFGAEPVRLQRGRDDVRVKVRYQQEARNRLGELERIRIRTPQGHEVPFLSVAEVTPAPGYASINRTDGLRRVGVTAHVDNERANAQEIVQDMNQNYFPELMQRYPGLSASFEGMQEEVRESVESLIRGLIIALFGIFLLIATIFRSYIQPFLIMLTIPFGLIGAVIGHMIMGYTVSLMSLFGMVTLAGIVVNAGILLIEKVNTLVGEGVPFYEALTRAGARRFRAIFLTTMSTCAGLTPLILETDMQAQFLIPMAITIAAGVAFSTVLTLVFLPCQLAALNDLRRFKHRVVYGVWPAPEEVEPGWHRVNGGANGAGNQTVSGEDATPVQT